MRIILSVIAASLVLHPGTEERNAGSLPVFKQLLHSTGHEMKKENLKSKKAFSNVEDDTSANEVVNDEQDTAFDNDCETLSAHFKAILRTYKEDAQNTLEQAKSFKPGRDWYVQVLNDSRNRYLLAAISPSNRKQLQEDTGDLYPCLEKIIDEIALVAAKTLPLYKPVGYTVRNASEEKLIRSAVNDLDNAKVLHTGMLESNWLIEKNKYGVPTARYKHGMIYAQYPKSITDDGYCRIIYVNILQDYTGDGSYGASYSRFIRTEPAGCSK